MKRKLTAGQTSVSLPIFIQDTSSTTGGGLSGLTSGTSGLVAEYRRRGQSSWTAITLTSKTLGTWTSGGIVADGALSGAYELDLPDAVCASGARWVAVRLRGAANMLPCLIEIELDACDYQVDALGAVKPTTAGRTLTVDTSGFVVLQDGSLTATKFGTNAISGQAVASVAGDVGGKVLGGGVGTISGDGVRAVSVTNGVTLAANQDVRNVSGTLPAVTLAASQPNYAPSKAGDQMDLINTPNATARQAFATTLEAAMFNEADATALLAAIAAKVEQFLINDGDATATLAAIGTAVNSAIVAGQIGTDLTTTKASAATAATQATNAASTAATINTKIGSPAATLAADIASVKTDTATTIPGLFTALTTKIRKFFQLIVRKDTAIATDNATELSELNANGGSGAGAYSQATDSLEAIRDRGDAAWVTGSGGGGSGTGARTVTITVNDGTTALQNATVRLTEGANTFTASTNASGVATFNVDDATYTVAITKPGYSYSGTTLAVSASTSVTYSMTAITITPSTGDQTTGYLTTLDETGAAEAGVSIYVSVADVPNDYGLALDEATRTVVSDEDGLVEITGMVKGATYNLRRGLKGRLFPVTIPTSAGSTYELPNMAGT